MPSLVSSGVGPSATTDLSDTFAAQPATNPPAIAAPTQDATSAGTANPSQDGAAKLATADPSPDGATKQDGATKVSSPTASATASPTSPASAPKGTASPLKPDTKSTSTSEISKEAPTQIPPPDTPSNTPSNTLSNTPSNTPSNIANAAGTDSSSESSATPTNTASSIASSSTTDSGTAATSTPPTNLSSGSDIGTQTPTNASITGGVGSAPGSNAIAATNSGSSFLQNKPLVIGLSVAGGLLILLFIAYVVMRLLRGRRRRQLDREMDASFEQMTHQASAGWRRMPSLDLDTGAGVGAGAQRAASVRSTASNGSYAGPPLAVPQMQQYNYAREYPVDYHQGPPAMGGAIPAQGMGMGMGPQMVQQVYAPQAYAHAQPGLVYPPQSAVMHHAESQGQVQRNDYLSNYTSPPPPATTGSLAPDAVGSPVSPTTLPNPFDGGVLKVTNA